MRVAFLFFFVARAARRMTPSGRTCPNRPDCRHGTAAAWLTALPPLASSHLVPSQEVDEDGEPIPKPAKPTKVADPIPGLEAAVAKLQAAAQAARARVNSAVTALKLEQQALTKVAMVSSARRSRPLPTPHSPRRTAR